MARLSTRPTGTVTFLFTDIEGSTRLWDEQPDAMAKALARHDEILRSAVESHSGVIFKHTGDGVCAAFQDPGDALDAAVAGQAVFGLEVFESIGRMAVRMAIHTGQADELLGDYRGPALNWVARLLDDAAGGEILLTDTVRDIVRATLPNDIHLADLGEHRLRDISEPGHIYHVTNAGEERQRRIVVPWLAALGATTLLAAALAVFSWAGPPGTETPATTIPVGPATTSPVASPETTVPVGGPESRWIVTPGGGPITLAAHDGILYVGSGATGLHAYRAGDAVFAWDEPGLMVDADQPLIEPFGSPVFGTPVVGDGLVIYSTYLGTLHAVDLESGALRWWHRFERCPGGECSPIVPSQPIMLNHAVFIAAGSELYRFEAGSGSFVRVDSALGSVTVGPSTGGQYIYVADGRSLLQFDAENLVLTRSLFLGEGVPVGYQAAVTSIIAPAMPLGIAAESDHGVFVTDAEGFLTRRSLETGALHPAWAGSSDGALGVEVGTQPVVGPGIGGRSAPTLWAVNSAGLLVGVDSSNGRQIASHAVGPTTQPAVVGRDGTVLIATDDLELVGYDPVLGSETIRVALVAAPQAAPVAVGGRVFIAGVDGTVRAYGSGGEIAIEGDMPAPGVVEGSISGVAWSSEGALAYVQGGHVWVLPSGGGEVINLTALRGGGSAPAWSPDGSMLAYTTGSVGSDVYVIRPDGTGRRNLTESPSADERDPAWAPDGSRIIFSVQACADQGGPQSERVCSGISELAFFDTKTGRIRPVVEAPAVFASDREPCWAPNGDLIAFRVGSVGRQPAPRVRLAPLDDDHRWRRFDAGSGSIRHRRAGPGFLAGWEATRLRVGWRSGWGAGPVCRGPGVWYQHEAQRSAARRRRSGVVAGRHEAGVRMGSIDASPDLHGVGWRLRSKPRRVSFLWGCAAQCLLLVAGNAGNRAESKLVS